MSAQSSACSSINTFRIVWVNSSIYNDGPGFTQIEPTLVKDSDVKTCWMMPKVEWHTVDGWNEEESTVGTSASRLLSIDSIK